MWPKFTLIASGQLKFQRYWYTEDATAHSVSGEETSTFLFPQAYSKLTKEASKCGKINGHSFPVAKCNVLENVAERINTTGKQDVWRI